MFSKIRFTNKFLSMTNLSIKIGTLLLLVGSLNGQNVELRDWFHLDWATDQMPGVSTQKLYEEIIQDKKGQKVVVAVLDSGIDLNHEDLSEVKWRNEDEVMGNGIDDDGNGYIDDIFGWSFLGNANGVNVQQDNLEATRIMGLFKEQFDGVDEADIKKRDLPNYLIYKRAVEEVESSSKEAEENFGFYGMLTEAIEKLKLELGKDEVTKEDLENLNSNDPMIQSISTMLVNIFNQGMTFDQIEGELSQAYEYFETQVKFWYNPNFNSRSIVGDDINNKKEKLYGNNDFQGPDAHHGTHVAGIIGAQRGNGIGLDGVANNVAIMSVRVVPDGDERDKDVANAIRYAVDNGAKVINMSFGKGFSPYKQVVDKAIRYAVRKDVVLIHAAGNEGKENNFSNNFPNDKYNKKGLFGKSYANSWLEVGALAPNSDTQLAASFSNYSREWVDVFAPGQEIYSSTPDNNYEMLQGTSMAAPMVAGVAALLRSYFPKLKAREIKKIIMDSATRIDQMVIKPGTSEEEVNFSDLSVTGGIVNAYEAFKLAEKMNR
jgi:subtilisin family serine protease